MRSYRTPVRSYRSRCDVHLRRVGGGRVGGHGPKKLIAFVSAAAILTAVFVPLGATAHANPDTNTATSDCMGVERGMRNRNGGDREHGAFGPPQVETVQALQPYGQWTRTWTDGNC